LYKGKGARLILGDSGAACREIESLTVGKTCKDKLERKQEPLGTESYCANTKVSFESPVALFSTTVANL